MSEAHGKRGTILIVDDVPANVGVLLDQLSRHSFRVLVAESGPSALKQVEHAPPDLILLDVMMPGLDGFETCRRLKMNDATSEIPVIFMTALSETVDKVRGFGAGAVDYVTKPFQHEEVLARVNTHLKLRRLQHELRAANEHLEQRVADRTAELSEANASLKEALDEVEDLKNRLQAENRYLQDELKTDHDFETIIGGNGTLAESFGQVERVAPTDATVLILGETGTGKELFARAIHDLSARSAHPLVKVNCAALPAELIESELFGHEKGAFTGAIARKTGRFELADGGTIFLDEIGDLPLELQAKLLRVLQEGEFERLGSSTTLTVDVRVIAATNRDLAKAIDEGTFREDLYYRLNVFPIALPPLRERLEDIPSLVWHFVEKYSKKIGRPIDTVPKPVMKALASYGWPGNVRELENVIERAVILTDGTALYLDDVLETARTPAMPTSGTATLEEAEREYILQVLESTNWRVRGKRGTAEILDINPSTLRSRMKKLGIERPR